MVIASHQGGTGLIDSGLEATYGFEFFILCSSCKTFSVGTLYQADTL